MKNTGKIVSISRERWASHFLQNESVYWESGIKENGESSFEAETYDYGRAFGTAHVDSPESLILEIGAGVHQHARKAFPLSCRRVYLDPLYGVIEQRIVPLLNDFSGIYISSPAEEIPLLANSVDAVFSVNVLNHVYSPAAILAETRRVLKFGSPAFFEITLEQQDETEHPHYFTVDNSLQLFAESGLVVARHDVWDRPSGRPFKQLAVFAVKE